MKHCITLDDFSADEVNALVHLAIDMKNNPESYRDCFRGKVLLMLFQKTSTRTRISFEVGFGRFGGQVVVMDWGKSNFSISPIEYEARYVSSQTDILMARLKHHSDVINLARHSRAPVINGCDDKFHPCQALADLVTIYENAGTFQGQTLVYVGIHNNVANSLACGLSQVGGKLVLVTPETNQAADDPALMERLMATGLVERTTDLKAAVSKAQFVYTDTWIDMEFFNDESYQDEKKRRVAQMIPYQLNEENLSGSDAFIMHDMPIHPGFEISEEMVYHPRSIIFQQADNRLYAQQALMKFLLENTGS
ncbi:MAG: ornithine carbamoyltransferase [Deltaproteobacteria bacterium]|nr:ornithine carbamoyltransferase [Deltaproteobacteria bacterium]